MARERRLPGNETHEIVQRRDRHDRNTELIAQFMHRDFSPLPRSSRSNAIRTPAGFAPCDRQQLDRFALRAAVGDHIVDDQHPARSGAPTIVPPSP